MSDLEIRFWVTVVLLGIWWGGLMLVAITQTPDAVGDIPDFQSKFAWVHGVTAALAAGALGYWFGKSGSGGTPASEHHFWIFLAVAFVVVSVPLTAFFRMRSKGGAVKDAAFRESGKVFVMLVPSLTLIATFYFGAPTGG